MQPSLLIDSNYFTLFAILLGQEWFYYWKVSFKRNFKSPQILAAIKYF